MLGITRGRGGFIPVVPSNAFSTIRRSRGGAATPFVLTFRETDGIRGHLPRYTRRHPLLPSFLSLLHLLPFLLPLGLAFRFDSADDNHHDESHEEQCHADRSDDDEWDSVEIASFRILSPSGRQSGGDVECEGSVVGSIIICVRQSVMCRLEYLVSPGFDCKLTE